MKRNRIRNTVEYIVACLVAGHYAVLDAHSFDSELPPGYVQRAIAEYGGTPVSAPDHLYQMDIVRHPEIPRALFVNLLLWLNDQQSDLTLRFTLLTNEVLGPIYRFTITDVDAL